MEPDIMVRRWISFAVVALVVLGGSVTSSRAATLVAKISLSQQTMTVIHRGEARYLWKVSTARDGKVTPPGQWTPKRLKRFHFSSRYGHAPMPFSIFYSGNFAIHGTNQTSKLGSPASAGCIRLSRSNAATLFSMARRAGLRNMLVIIEP